MVDFQSNLKEIPMEYIKLVPKDVNEVRLRWKAFFLDILHKHAPITKITVKRNSLPLWHLSWGPWLKPGTTSEPKQIRQDLNVYGRPLTIPETKWTNFFQTYKKTAIQKRLKRITIIWKEHGRSSNKNQNLALQKKEAAIIFNEHFVSVGKKACSGYPRHTWVSSCPYKTNQR